MNQRSEKEIDRMRKLFASIGADLEPCNSVRSAAMTAEGDSARKTFKTSDACGKLIYPSEPEAIRAIKSRKKRGAGALRCYKCEGCRGYHISSYFARW